MKAFLSPTFIIGQIRIGSIEGASCVNFGNNRPSHFTNHKKHIQGFGSVSGDHNKIEGARTALNDSDFIDMLNMTDEVPDWIKSFLKQKLENKGVAIDEQHEGR